MRCWRIALCSGDYPLCESSIDGIVWIHFNAAKSKNYTTPRSAGITLCVRTIIPLYMKSAVPNKSNTYNQGPGAIFIPCFPIYWQAVSHKAAAIQNRVALLVCDKQITR